MSAERDTDVERDRLSTEISDLTLRNEELSDENESLRRRNQQLEALLKRLGAGPTERLEQAYSLKAEEQRQANATSRGRKKQKSPRRGRISTAEKLKRADRTEIVIPPGWSREACRLHRQRPVWRIENGRAVLVAYEIYRGPDGTVPTVPGLLPRCEFGWEILIALGFQTQIVELSLAKVRAEQEFFWGLRLSKSQVDALLSRLAREWHAEFDLLCDLLLASAVVRTDGTSWSIGSVWTFLSEQSRLMIFGCRQDAATLELLLPKETFGGTVVSDDAAIYRGFTQAQKCWAHPLRKAIKLTLLAPRNKRYREFKDGLLALYRLALRAAADKRLGPAGRQRRIDELELQLCDLCQRRIEDSLVPPPGVERDFYNLVHELVRLMAADELFTFVRDPSVPATNNESERSLRSPARQRRTDQTSRSVPGARRRTILTSVLESLRTQLPTFDLQSVQTEISRWYATGRSCFARLARQRKLPRSAQSLLDRLVPLPNSS